MPFKRFIAGLALALAVSGTCRAELISGYTAAKNDRFYAGPNKAFIGGTFDLSGVGNTNANGTGRFATLISPQYVLTAAHYAPGVGSTVTFHEGDSPTGTVHTYKIASGVRVGTSDLYLEKLAAPVLASDNIHPVTIAADNASYLTGKPIYVYGGSNQLGMNNIDAIIPDDAVSGSSAVGTAFMYGYNPAKGFGAEEAKLVGGDSGGPSFVSVNGQLQLVGIHWYQYASSNLAIVGSGDSYVPAYAALIRKMIGSSGNVAIAPGVVPEPSSLALLAIGIPGVLFAIHRRSLARKAAAA